MTREALQPSPQELPVPYEGVCEEVLFDLCSDPDNFSRSTLVTMREENPYLTKHLLAWFMTSPNRQTSQEWLLAYYAIYSRSAKKRGLPMFKVSEDLIVAFSQERAQTLQGLVPPKTKRQQERLDAYLHSIEEQKDQLRNDEAKNKELASFWNHIRLWSLRNSLVGKTPREVEIVLEPLSDLMLFLHRQEESNRFTQRFSK